MQQQTLDTQGDNLAQPTHLGAPETTATYRIDNTQK